MKFEVGDYITEKRPSYDNVSVALITKIDNYKYYYKVINSSIKTAIGTYDSLSIEDVDEYCRKLTKLDKLL